MKIGPTSRTMPTQKSVSPAALPARARVSPAATRKSAAPDSRATRHTMSAGRPPAVAPFVVGPVAVAVTPVTGSGRIRRLGGHRESLPDDVLVTGERGRDRVVPRWRVSGRGVRGGLNGSLDRHREVLR